MLFLCGSVSAHEKSGARDDHGFAWAISYIGTEADKKVSFGRSVEELMQVADNCSEREGPGLN